MKPAVVASSMALLAPWVAAAQVPPVEAGYAFDKPRVLAQQLVWGRLHGVRLLAQACRERGDGNTMAAYVGWLESQSSTIAAAQQTLSLHYFGHGPAPLEAIDAALKLKPALNLTEDELAAGCATLPAALAQPRNDLRHYYVELRTAIERGDGDLRAIGSKGP